MAVYFAFEIVISRLVFSASLSFSHNVPILHQTLRIASVVIKRLFNFINDKPGDHANDVRVQRVGNQQMRQGTIRKTQFIFSANRSCCNTRNYAPWSSMRDRPTASLIIVTRQCVLESINHSIYHMRYYLLCIHSPISITIITRSQVIIFSFTPQCAAHASACACERLPITASSAHEFCTSTLARRD